jgi:hypothetical protein
MVLETLHRPAQSIESADLWVEPDKAFPKIAEPIPCKVEKAKGRGVGWILAILMTLINIQEAMATSTTMASTHRQLSLIQGVVFRAVLIRIVQLWTDFHYRTIICLILRRTMRISLMISTISENTNHITLRWSTTVTKRNHINVKIEKHSASNKYILNIVRWDCYAFISNSFYIL